MDKLIEKFVYCFFTEPKFIAQPPRMMPSRAEGISFSAHPKEHFTGSPTWATMRWNYNDIVIERSRKSNRSLDAILLITGERYSILIEYDYWTSSNGNEIIEYIFEGDADAFETDVLLLKLEQE